MMSNGILFTLFIHSFAPDKELLVYFALGITLIGLFGFLLGAFLDWKCPKCDTQLMLPSPNFCPSCGMGYIGLAPAQANEKIKTALEKIQKRQTKYLRWIFVFLVLMVLGLLVFVQTFDPIVMLVLLPFIILEKHLSRLYEFFLYRCPGCWSYLSTIHAGTDCHCSNCGLNTRGQSFNTF